MLLKKCSSILQIKSIYRFTEFHISIIGIYIKINYLLDRSRQPINILLKISHLPLSAENISGFVVLRRHYGR